MQKIMGNIPADRLRGQRPFLATGVDFCGLFRTSYRWRRKSPYKSYAAVFLCFASKALLLDAVSDLSKGLLHWGIYCDNATNFTGTAAKIEKFKRKQGRTL